MHIAAAIVIAALSCAQLLRDLTPIRTDRFFRGAWMIGFETSSFTEERPRLRRGMQERWWLAGRDPCPTPRVAAGVFPDARRYRIEVRGWISTPGSYGHTNGYDRELTVSEAVRCVEIGMAEPPAPGSFERVLESEAD